MKNALKQLAVLVAVVGICLVFVFEFRPGARANSSGGPRCVVEISGECVPHSDYTTALRILAPSGVNDDRATQLRKTLIEGLIERWLLVEDAKRLGLSVSDDDVTKAIGRGFAQVSLPVSASAVSPPRQLPIIDPKTKKFDYERYKRWVTRTSTKTMKDFREFQRQELLAERMRALIRMRVRVSEAEAYARYSRINEKVTVDYIKLERGFYRDHVIDRSDEAIDAWVKNNTAEVDQIWASQKDSYLPECRKTRHILIRIDDTEADKEVAKGKALEKLQAARKRIEDGESFAAVARALSEDPLTASKGGDLGCFAAGKLSALNTAKPVDDAAYATEPGKFSEPVQTSNGMHLVMVDAVADAAAAEKIGRRTVSLDLYLKKESERMASEAGSQMLAAVKGGKTLEQALQSHFDAVLPAAAKEAFAKGQGTSEGEDKEGDDKEGADKDEEKTDDAGGPDAWTDPLRPRIATSDPFTRGTPPFAGVQQPMNASTLLFGLEKPGQVPGDIVKLHDGYAVAQLKERAEGTKDDWDKQRPAYFSQLRAEKQRDALLDYVHRLKDKYGKEIALKVKLDDGKTPAPTEGG